MSETLNSYIFPASFSQKRLWLLDQISPHQAGYNITRNLCLSGKLDVAALERSLNEVIRRHEVLRTNFAEIEGEPAQVVKPFTAQRLEIRDLSGTLEEKCESELLNLLSNEAQRTFDFEADSLIRFKLFRLSDTENVLALNLHHIIADGWSMGILVGEISLFYEAFSKNEISSLDELSIQYGDFAIWQKDRNESEEFAQSLNFWKKNLSDGENLLNLPIDFPRPVVQTFNGALTEFTIDAPTAEQIKRICVRENVSLFMFLAAVFDCFLYRITGANDINIGTPTANRTQTELENLIGFFVNTLVLRVKFSKNETFSEMLAKVRETALDAFANQEIPFEQVVEAVQPERDLSYSPLFQTMLVVQNAPPGELKTADLTLREIVIPHRTAKFDLTLQAFENKGEIVCAFEYNTDLFKAETVERFSKIFTVLLKNIVQNPQAKLSEFQILDDLEKKEIIGISSGEKLEPDKVKDVVGLFEKCAFENPEKIAIASKNEPLTYGDLNRKAGVLAHVLVGKGITPEMRVAVCAERSADFAVGLLAAMKAGAAYVPLDPNYPSERLQYILKDSNAAILLTQKHLLEKLPTNEISHLFLDEIEETEQQSAVKIELQPENAAYLIYTSGSTGQPKGVVVSRRNLAYSTAARFAGYEIQIGAYLLLSPFAFDSSVAGIFWTLATGGTLVLPPDDFQQDLHGLVSLMAEKRVTHLLCLPSFYDLILQIVRTDELETLQTVIVAGEPCPSELVFEHFKTLPNAELFNEYGPTENTVWSSVFECLKNAENVSRIPIGKSIAETENLVLDDAFGLAPSGVWGELFLGGKGVARGYFGNPALTAEKFVPHPFSNKSGARLYRTGDRARYLSDGNLEFGGRFDEQIKLRGFRIELGEIERNLAKFEPVAEAVAVVQGDGNSKRLAAFLRAENGRKIETETLREFLGNFLPDYMIPVSFTVLDEIPRTANGKTDRKKLAALKIEADENEFVAPRDLIEELLANIWTKTLKLEKVGVTDNFFHIGGHSLLAGQIASQIKKIFGAEISLRRIFENPTIKSLAKQIKSNKTEAKKPKKLSRPNLIPLSFAQKRLWFLAQIDGESAVYNVPSVLRLRGEIDIFALEKSLNNLINRHEILRTVYVLQNGEPIQIVREKVSFEIERKAISESLENLQNLISEEINKPFALENEIPVRARLIETGTDENYLILTIHHIATDAFSMPILINELAAFYGAETSGNAANLAALDWQYADYAVWQTNEFTEEKKEKELGFWREYLQDAPEILDLPTDKPRPVLQTYNGATCEFSLSAESVSQLRQLCRDEQITPFIALLAVFKVLLFRFSNQSDIVTGITFSERSHEEFRPLIGFFVNTLALRTKIGARQSFRDFLREIKQNALAVYAHGDTPFELLAQELNPARNLSHTPLFQVMFSLQHEPVKVFGATNLSIEAVAVPNDKAKFDLSLSILTNGEQISGAFEYNTDLFERETIESLTTVFQSLINNLTDSPDKKVSEVSLFIDEKAKAEILEIGRAEKNGRKTDETLVGLFSKQANANPQFIAVEDGNSVLSYGELDNFSSGFAENLSKSFDIKAEKIVGLLLNRSANSIKAMLSVLKTGAAYLPLDASYPFERLKFMTSDAQVSAIICDDANRDLAESLKTDVPITNIEEIELGKSAFRAEFDEENAAYLIYTSGTTGQPKGVTATHKNLFNLALVTTKKYELTANDRVLWFSSASFDVAAEEIFPTLISGGCVVVRSDEMVASNRDFWESIEKRKISVLNLPASFWEQSFTEAKDEGIFAPETLRLMIAGSEPISPAAVKNWHEFTDRSIKLFNAYGPTETTVTATLYDVSDFQNEARMPIGAAIENIETFVLDSSLEPLPRGFIGEIYIGGAGVTRGYHKRAELTAEKFVPHPFSASDGERLYRTGDLARILPNGAIDLLGRSDSQVKIRGFRIETAEIEAQIKRTAGVREAVVAVSKNEADEPQLVAYLSTNAANFDVETLRNNLKKTLPNYMIPRLVLLEKLPHLPNGKIDFRALSGFQPAQEKLAVLLPENNLEKKIATVWRDLLKTENFGVNDNFFDLGGHSLLLIKVNAALSAKIGTKLAIVDLFRYPTIRALAEFLNESENNQADAQKTAHDRAANRRKMMNRRTAGGK